MGKELTFKMSKKIVGMAEKPLRTREEAVLLLLYSIRMFDAERFFEDRRNEEVKISINKMNRMRSWLIILLILQLLMDI